jgi:hypothetical protein
MVGSSHRVFRLSSTAKTGRHDIAEILLRVVLKHNKSIKSIKYNCEHFKNSILEFARASNHLVILDNIRWLGLTLL